MPRKKPTIEPGSLEWFRKREAEKHGKTYQPRGRPRVTDSVAYYDFVRRVAALMTKHMNEEKDKAKVRATGKGRIQDQRIPMRSELPPRRIGEPNDLVGIIARELTEEVQTAPRGPTDCKHRPARKPRSKVTRDQVRRALEVLGVPGHEW